MARILVPAILIGLLGVIYGQMWFGPGGVPKVTQLENDLVQQKAANKATEIKNEQIASEIDDLKNGLGMVEGKARSELGMVRPNEIFVQILPPGSHQTDPQTNASPVPVLAAKPPAPARSGVVANSRATNRR
jgi:cell division protein FtsB